jgi:hypothetical protein
MEILLRYSYSNNRMLITYLLLLSQTSTPNLEIFGQVDGAEFGRSAANAADINQDGVDDIIIGAPLTTINGMTESGAVYLHSGADGSLIRQWYGLAAADYFGTSVSGAGDLNGDNIPDILISANGASPNNTTAGGSVYAYSGADGSLIHQWDGTYDNSSYGGTLAGGEDVNADGVPDVIISAANADPNGILDAGEAFIYSGATGSLIYYWHGVNTVEALGRGSSFVGDIDNDGTVDFAISASGGANNYGQVTVYSGNGGAQLLQLTGPYYGGDFGHSVAGLGDINADGYDDIVVGAPRESANGLNWTGAVYAFSGADGSQLFMWEGTGRYNLLGKCVSSAGDFNQDGVPDILIGQGGHDSNGHGQSGAAFVYSGTDGLLIQQINGRDTLDWLGRNACHMGDLDSDGYTDILLTIQGDDVNGLTDNGSVGLYSNRTTLPLYEILGAVAPYYLEAGDYADFTVTGCPPFAPVIIGYSLRGAGPLSTAFGIVDLTPPVQVLAVMSADSMGIAVFNQYVPGNASGVTLYSQCKVGNVLSTSVAAYIN